MHQPEPWCLNPIGIRLIRGYCRHLMTVMVSLFRKRGTPLVPRAARPSRGQQYRLVIHTCHFDDYISADTSRQFPICVTTTLLQSDSTIAPNEKLDAPDHMNSTRAVALLAPSSPPATILECLHVLARTTALLSWLGTLSFAWRCAAGPAQTRHPSE